MNSSATSSYPRRRSLIFWSLLALLMVLGSYAVTLALAAGCIYLPYLVLTNISLGLQTIALAACGLVIGVTLLWSLVPRREKVVVPGPRLEPRDEPRLFAEIKAIAQALGEPMPEDVYLTGDVNAFVAQWRRASGSGSRRVMAVGLPLMQVLTLSQFRAVLAHEFGHYYSGDTALGPWVYRSRATMIRTLQGLGQPSEVLKTVTRIAFARLTFHIVLNVLVWYWKLFLKATQLVSRRQEYRADELACYVAGSQALIAGLRAINGAAPALPAYWQQAVVPALQHGVLPPVLEGFSRFLCAPQIAKAVEDNLEQQMRRPVTNPYDSHPPLRDRVAAAQRLPAGQAPESDPPAAALLDHPESAEDRLLEFVVRPKLEIPKLKRVSWDATGPDVILPGWRKLTQDFSQLLSAMTAESLAAASKELRSLGSHIPDPKGMLLTREQRDQRAGGLLASALGVLLADRGWEVHVQPGEAYLARGSERLDPFAIVRDLTNGKLTPEAWSEQCRNLGIAGLPLSGATKPGDSPHSARPESLPGVATT